MFCLGYPDKIHKTFVFQKQQTQQSVFVEEEVDLRPALVDLSELLRNNASPTLFRVAIYDPETNQFSSLHKLSAENGLIPRRFLEPSIILVRYRKREEQNFNDDNLQSSFEGDSKNKKDIRSKERTIGQAIALVKRWRELHLTASKPGNIAKRMNLQEAAREIGISKKSLDDYYCQLRLAEMNNFNFMQNMNQRMGKLRNFVKQHRTDESIRIRHHKHPKNLRIIQQFVMDAKMQEYIVNQRENERESDNENENEINLRRSPSLMLQENNFLGEFTNHKLFNLQDEYYKGFEFIMDDPSDPFLFQNRDFSKKIYDEESEGSLFIRM